MAPAFKEGGTESKESAGEKAREEIAALLAGCRTFITYVPLRGEVPFRDYLSLPEDARLYEVKPRAALDPAAEALAAMEAAGDTRAVVLMPGRLFDATGTRHGQGGGWYDRFLARVPKEWVRIGFCYRRQFSDATLRRESWDQPMDAVCVVDGGSLSVYETNAR